MFIKVPHNCLFTYTGERGHGVIAKILRGAPDVRKTSGMVTQGQTSSLSKQIHASSIDTTDGASQAKTLQRCKDTINISKHELGHDKLLSVAKPDQKNLSTDILNERTSSAPTEIQTLEFQKLQLQTDILEEVRNRQYKIQIAPSDLIDFGGQKSYDMTHQLFIQHTGSFLLMFDGRYGLHEEIDGVTAKGCIMLTLNIIMHNHQNDDSFSLFITYLLFKTIFPLPD